MLIVQISDVHCGPMFNAESSRTAMDEINAMSSDAVVIAGDVTEDGILLKFRIATEELRGLGRKASFHKRELLQID